MGKKLLITFLLTLTLITMVGCIDEPATISTNEITSDNITTDQPTTNLPTTEAPTTDVPTTEEPTTEAPTTEEPTTEAPTTEVPTTEEPTTELPTTEAPTTEAPTTSNPIDELFFSEYIEGSSYNKAVEIFNGTGSQVDLSVYSIKIYFNGSSSVGNTISLSGTIDHNDVFVVSHTSADALILDDSDLADGDLNFNGNDAVGLYKNDVLIDLIGEIGSGSDFAKDATLVRADNVFSGNLTYNPSEWDSYSADTFEYLGIHSDLQPTDDILLQQDIDQLEDTINLYTTYDFGTGSNGSTYTITGVTGDASQYVIYADNVLTSELETEGNYSGQVTVLVNLEGVGSQEVTIPLNVIYEVNDYDHTAYYSSIDDGLSGETLLLALRSLLNDTYQGVTYGEARYILDESDADPANPNNVILVYLNNSVDGTWDGGSTWNREHVWPQSYLGESADNNTVNMASDLHNLKPADPSENSSRGNKYFDNVTSPSTYEPRDEVKGDIARILLYMIVMYEVLDLVNDSTNTTVYEMGVLDTLLSWHIQDPVDDFEMNRNHVIYTYQGNLNPFIDNPEWVDLIWGDTTN